MDLTFGQFQKAGKAVQQRRFTAARRPQQNDELALFDIKVQVLQNLGRAELQG